MTVAGVIAAIGATPTATASAALSHPSLIEATAAALPSALAGPLRFVREGLAVRSSVSTVTAAASRLRQPADLVALEQKMRKLHINSERVVVDLYVSGPHLGRLFTLHSSKHRRSHRHVRLIHASLPQAPKQTIPLLRLDAEASVSPKLAVIRGVVLGISIQVREIGEQLYTRSPLTEADGGRPWVYESPAEQAEARAKSRGEGEASPFSQLGGTGGEVGEFGKTAEMLAHARSAVEIGPKTVDGQQTTEFELALAPSEFLGKRPAAARSKRKQRTPHAKVTMYVYLAGDGLPVSTRFRIAKGSDAVVIAADILATEIPISVSPPPASETITMPELEKLREKESSSPFTHLSKREREEARRFERCLNRHLSKHAKHLSRRESIKVVHECERVAKRGSK